jgi:hypothetical protein
VSRGVTKVAESEVVRMAIGEAAAAIDAATMVYAQHQMAWALDKLCERDGARWRRLRKA